MYDNRIMISIQDLASQTGIKSIIYSNKKFYILTCQTKKYQYVFVLDAWKKWLAGGQ